MSAADVAPAAIDDVSGRRLAVAQIAMGSVVTAYGQLADNIDNPAAWGLAAFFMLLQWGMSHRAWQARLLWRRGHWISALVNVGAMLTCAWFVHAALLQALDVAAEKQLLHGFEPSMLAGAMILLPLIEPLGLWTHALLTEPAPAPTVRTEDAAPKPITARPPGPVTERSAVAAAASGAIGINLGGAGIDQSVAFRSATPTMSPAVASTYAGHADPRAHALALWGGGERNISSIARTVGRPRTTVQRWLARGRVGEA
jgi:hypothetical protein